MPRVVDGDARRSEIAVAALRLAGRDGLSAVTFRAVATEMGAGSTTVVTHYAPNRAALVGLMMGHLFGLAEQVVEPAIANLSPREALELLAEAVLPLTPESKVLAALALDAAREFGTAGRIGDELEDWGDWLRARIRSLVVKIGTHPSTDEATDAVVAGLAGITLYGVVDADNWPPDRQRGALRALLVGVLG